MGFQLPNYCLQENIMGFQLHGVANKVISEENQYHAIGNTVNFKEFQMHGTTIKVVSEEIWKLCKTYGFIVFLLTISAKSVGWPFIAIVMNVNLWAYGLHYGGHVMVSKVV